MGLNGIVQTLPVRKLFLEAFCFAAIFKNLDGDQYGLYDEFVKAIKELYQLNLGIDQEERLLRAQGAMFMLMKNNESLRQILLEEYQQNRDILPFLLIHS